MHGGDDIGFDALPHGFGIEERHHDAPQLIEEHLHRRGHRGEEIRFDLTGEHLRVLAQYFHAGGVDPVCPLRFHAVEVFLEARQGSLAGEDEVSAEVLLPLRRLRFQLGEPVPLRLQFR